MRYSNSLYWLLQGFTSVVLGLAGLFKLVALVPISVFSFQTGIPISFLQGIGVLEVMLVMLQLHPTTRFLGQIGLWVILAGAVSVHLISQLPFNSCLPALILLIGTSMLIALEYQHKLPVRLSEG